MRPILTVAAVIAAAGLAFAQPASTPSQPAKAPASTPVTTPAPKATPADPAPAKTPAAKPAKGGPKTEKPAGPTLKVGDPAPKLSTEEFVKGAKVESLEKGKVYVVEFWATWCPPCVKSIPHLTQLQKEHKDDLVVIGVAGSEREAAQGQDTRLANLKNFVKRQGPKMDYRVAYDEDRSMSRDWMQAAGENGIPCAFVVDKDSKIAYIGFPSNELDEAVEKLLGDPDDKDKDGKKKGAAAAG